jgi:hypothetical protein
MAGLGMIVFIALQVCWAEKRKGYKLLRFSAVCAICTALAAPGLRAAVQKGRQGDKQWTSSLSEFHSNVLQFVDHGATGRLPNVKLTGNPAIDMAIG